MVQIPERLASELDAGQCVLWAGAGLGALARRPGWTELLGRLVPRCAESDRPQLGDLLEQGRLRPVLGFVHRHLGDKALQDLLQEIQRTQPIELVAGAERLARVRWRAGLATVYGDVLQAVLRTSGGEVPLISHTDAHDLSLADERGPFVLRTPPSGRSMRADAVMFDLIEEVVRTRTIVFCGFDIDDPDLHQILELFGRVGRGRRHYALLPYVTRAEAEEMLEHYDIEIVPVDDGEDLIQVVASMTEGRSQASIASGDDRRVVELELSRAVRGLELRADLAHAEATLIELEPLQALFERFPGDALAAVDPTTLLRVGAVFCAHRRFEHARRCFRQVISRGVGHEYETIARFNLGLLQLATGEADEGVEHLAMCAESNRTLALVPPKLRIVDLVRRGADATLTLSCKDRETGEELDATTVGRGRPVSIAQRRAFLDQVERLRGLEEPSLPRVRGGFADAHLLGIVTAPVRGFVLEDLLVTESPMSLARAFQVLGPVMEGIAACHGRGVFHGGLDPSHIVVTAAGTVVRGFGFPTHASLPGYRAPEHRVGDRATAEGDVYALGAVLYRCVTGREPVGPMPLGDLDSRVAELFARMLASQPQARPRPRDLRSEIAALLTSPEPVAARLGGDTKPERAAVPLAARGEQETTTVDVGGAQVTAPRPKFALPEDPDDLEAWAFVLEQKPNLPEAQRALVRIEQDARDAARWDRVAEVMMVRAQNTQVQNDRVELLRELAQIFEHEVGAPANAFITLQALIEEVPVPTQVRLIDDLVRLGELTGNHSPLLEVVESVVDRVPEPETRARLHAVAGRLLLEQLGAVDRAMVAYERALQAGGDDLGVLQALVSLYRRTGRTSDLAATAVRLAELQTGPARRELLMEAARAYAGTLDDAEAAFRAVEAVRAEEPGHAEALALAEDLARRLGRLTTLLDVLGRRMATTADRSDLRRLHQEAAEVAARLGDDVRALAENRRVLDIDPRDRDAAVRTVELLRRAHEADPGRAAELADATTFAAELSTGSGAIEHWSRLLDLCRGSLGDRERELRALRALVELEPEKIHWSDALLERLFVEGELAQVEPLAARRIDAEADPKRRAELLAGLGLARARAGQVPEAITTLQQATALDPASPKALLGLRDLFVRTGQPLKALEVQVAAARAMTEGERAVLLYEAARDYLQRVKDPARALPLLEEVVRIDPDHREATSLLLDRLVETGEWARALPVAEAFVAQVNAHAPTDQALNLRALGIAGRCALAVDERERAREYLDRARHLDATDLEVRRLLADLDLDAGRFAEALSSYQSVVLSAGDRLPAPDRARMYYGMARAQRGLDQSAKAVQMIERAVELAPDDGAALRLWVELADEGGRGPERAKARRKLAEQIGRRQAASEGEAAERAIDERLEVLRALAEIQVEELNLPEEAIQTLEEMLGIREDDAAALHRMLDLFTTSSRWRDALSVLDRLAQARGGAHGPTRAKYLYAGAAILRDQLGDVDGALEWMARVLEADPTHGKAFTTRSELLEKDGAYHELAKLIRARLKAIAEGASPAERAELLERLGDIYQRHLGDEVTALAAFEQALALEADPDLEVVATKRQRVIALALGLGGDHVDRGIAQAHALIRERPMEFPLYHELVTLYLQRGQRDRAIGIARALRFFKQADPAELRLLEEIDDALPTPRGTMTPKLWRQCVYHPLENPRLSDLLAIVWPMVAAREGRTHAHAGLARGDRRKPYPGDDTPMLRYVAMACQVLDAPIPDVYLRESEPGGLRVAALAEFEDGKACTVTPTLIAGRDATATQPPAALVFRAARAVARSRPEHILAATLPSGNSLRNAVYGAVYAAEAGIALPEDCRDEAKSYGEEIRRYLAPARQDQLKTVVARLLEEGGVDTRKWLDGVDHTVTRIAFALSDDFEQTARVLSQEPEESAVVPVKARLRDLLTYAVSEPYFALREALGIARVR